MIKTGDKVRLHPAENWNRPEDCQIPTDMTWVVTDTDGERAIIWPHGVDPMETQKAWVVSVVNLEAQS